ncbi:hypothetical protein A2165_03885 [Candidatus Curtissbacteria bacterium RBG_13_40_7]|uniref:Uncharacterized protein n=1 Tax=Candidatus Curtissbacteria bacterium RBG_13_40_7 TaxID=1797706 RepID=A0A1F5FTN5_9BACT|nr:MAG: hypothetical protein A2165_03885 [Candidatus Curtissbacteria bacterium RBG_13_40_7]
MKKVKYEYFVASSWRNRDKVIELVKKLRAKGKTVFSFFEGKKKVFGVFDPKVNPEEVMKRYESTKNWQQDPRIRKIFRIDFNALKNSQVFILLLPSGKSAHIEAGIAYGLGKKCILIGDQKEAESLYFIFDKMYLSIESFLKAI